MAQSGTVNSSLTLSPRLCEANVMGVVGDLLQTMKG
jgi:hypothetical protein